jgi:hypothetical protein
MKIIKKISPRTILGRTPQPGDTIEIAGDVIRVIAGESQYGPYVRLEGIFEGRIPGQQSVRATVAYIPIIGEMLLQKHLSKPDTDPASVGFHARLVAEPDDSVPIGYRWTVEMESATEKALLPPVSSN